MNSQWEDWTWRNILTYSMFKIFAQICNNQHKHKICIIEEFINKTIRSQAIQGIKFVGNRHYGQFTQKKFFFKELFFKISKNFWDRRRIFQIYLLRQISMAGKETNFLSIVVSCTYNKAVLRFYTCSKVRLTFKMICIDIYIEYWKSETIS